MSSNAQNYVYNFVCKFFSCVHVHNFFMCCLCASDGVLVTSLGSRDGVNEHFSKSHPGLGLKLELQVSI